MVKSGSRDMGEGEYVEPGHDVDDAKVICPKCLHQFRAISKADQEAMLEASRAIGRLRRKLLDEKEAEGESRNDLS